VIGTEDLREGVGEGRSGLYGYKVELSDVVAIAAKLSAKEDSHHLFVDIRVRESESTLALVVGDSTSTLEDVSVESTAIRRKASQACAKFGTVCEPTQRNPDQKR
jgi:hypothetical protein